MVDLAKVWKDSTGKDAIGEVRIGYETTAYTDGCCEFCYSEVTETIFYLLNNNERVQVSSYEVGIEEF